MMLSKVGRPGGIVTTGWVCRLALEQTNTKEREQARGEVSYAPVVMRKSILSLSLYQSCR